MVDIEEKKEKEERDSQLDVPNGKENDAVSAKRKVNDQDPKILKAQ